MIHLWFKFMLMISYFVLLIKNYVSVLPKTCRMEFEMSMMGELTFFLSLQVKQNKNGIFINQAKYIKDMLKKFEIPEVKEMATPMSPATILDKDEKGKDVNQRYDWFTSLLNCSRPNIMFSVCLCVRF